LDDLSHSFFFRPFRGLANTPALSSRFGGRSKIRMQRLLSGDIRVRYSFGVLMAESQAVSPEIELLQKAYTAFNRREIEIVLALMHADVDWPNGMEGGRVLGKDAVRDYWTRQFEVVQSQVEPKKFAKEADGRVAIDVHQVVHDNAGKLLADQMVQHVYEIRDGLIRSMEIRS
jgi:ketosteroid isomerase-like protein